MGRSKAVRAPAAHRAVERLAEDAKWYIWAVGGVLALVFTWLELREIPFGDALAGTRHDYLIRFTLVFYYLCWVAGSSFDVRVQRAVYSVDPEKGRSRLTTTAVIVAFAAVAAILLWVKDDEGKFALALSAFILTNALSWRYIVRVVSPIIVSSEKHYRSLKDHFGLQQLNCVARYMTGPWQLYRFVYMGAVMLAIDLVTFFPQLREAAGRALHALVPDVPAETVVAQLPAWLFVFLIATGEGWMWVMRARTQMWLDVLDELREEHVLRRRT